MRKDHRSGLERLEEQIVRKITQLKKSRYGITALCSVLALAVLAAVVGIVTVNAAQQRPASELPAVSGEPLTGESEPDSYEAVQEDDEYDANAQAIDASAFGGTVLPETEDAGEEYIKNTLFIGDSNSYRYMNYGFCTLDNDIGVVGMGAQDITKEKLVKFKGSDPVTIPQAVTIMQPQRIIFGVGTNNLTGDVKSFIKTYTAAIKAVYDAYPYCDIIVNAIPPVDKNRSYTNVTMQQIDTFNEALVQMCQDNEWKFLNSSEALKDSATGFCKREYTVSDGLHLSKEGCGALFNYIRTHAYETTDRRPKPLKSVPKRDAKQPEIITQDPLKTDQTLTKVDVTFVAEEGGTLEGTVEQSLKPGSVSSAVTAVPNEGFAFAGWNCSYSGVSDLDAETITYTVPKDAASYGGIFITATFKPIGYTVRFTVMSSDGGGLDESWYLTNNEKNKSLSVAVYSGKTATAVLKVQEGYVPAESKSYIVRKNNDGTYSISVEKVTEDLEIVVKLQRLATPTPSPSPSPSPSAAPSPSTVPTETPPPSDLPVSSPPVDPVPTPTSDQAPTPVPPEPDPTPGDQPPVTGEEEG